jgi:hypothetical protein
VSKEYALFLWGVAGAAFFAGVGGTLLFWRGNIPNLSLADLCVGLLAVGVAVGLSAGLVWQHHFNKTKQPRDDAPPRG